MQRLVIPPVYEHCQVGR